MSYSFTVNAKDHADAKEKLALKFRETLLNQPVHKADMEKAEAVANTYLDLLPANDDMDITMVCHGSVGWTGSQEEPVLTAANISVSAYFVTRPKE